MRKLLIYYFYYYYRAAQSSPSAGGPVPLPAENTQVPKNVPHSQPHATPVSPRGQQQPAKILQPVSYKDRDASSTPSPPLSGKALSPRGASKASKKSSKSKSKSKKGQKQKLLELPDGIEVSWRKPPPPNEVAEAMKFLKPKKQNPAPAPAAVKTEEKNESPGEQPLVSCPFCRGQFVDVSEHMDHCPVITAGEPDI